MDRKPAVRFRGNANNGNCSPRYLNANNAVNDANRNYAGFAQNGDIKYTQTQTFYS